MKPITETQFDPAFLTDKRFWWNRRTKEELAEPAEPCFHELLAIAQNEKKLFGLIATTRPPIMDGWCDLTKSCALAGLVLAMKPKVVLELGVWAGASLLPMAWAAQTYGGKVIGVDAWSAKESTKDEYEANAKWWGNQEMHDIIYRRACEFVSRFKLQDTVTLIKKATNDVEPMACGVFHLDANHCDQTVTDAERFGPKVEMGGIVVADDISWVGGSPLRAIDWLEEMGFVERFRFENQWLILQRTR